MNTIKDFVRMLSCLPDGKQASNAQLILVVGFLVFLAFVFVSIKI